MKKLLYLLSVGALVICAIVVLSFKSSEKTNNKAFLDAWDIHKGDPLGGINHHILEYLNQGYTVSGITSYEVNPTTERIVVAFVIK
ncbi:hypothetical protein HDF24_04755 [Mucilaginibacter sp. X4EP1]|uniref:hypothetical protein n=1 Tax=Mucilaginibacter sp. X4EP1 TaxID=2723092 RepID=UPI002168E49B|nr:hypothetical protein [Mucilaginibacter sp. X4EP1]MCS3816513.1 hypothetical protein [Mucilaginibacter sp. X4EP1]